MICSGIRRRRITLLFACVFWAVCAHVAAQEPAAGERREIKFVGEKGEECISAFRWCPSAVMKDGDPDDANGKPNAHVEGFWLSETEVSQQ